MPKPQSSNRRRQDFRPAGGRPLGVRGRAARGAAVGSYNQAVWAAGRKVAVTRQTSLVVDPPDGRVPVRPEAERQRDLQTAQSTDSYEFLNVWDRCITRGVPGGFFPAGDNNAYQIIQTPGFVVIVSEMIHDPVPRF